jgi:CubicO group peptidase (beta-lactamase class C family)
MTGSFAHATPEAVGLDASRLAAVNAEVRSRVDDGTLAGAVTLTMRHGRLIDLRTMGKKSLATGEPMAADTIFRIFSMTKPVTATAMMILHDEGLWRPADPIAKHLPEFEGVTLLAGEDVDGNPMKTAPERAPTMGDLITHRAGFAYGVPIDEPVDLADRLYRAADLWNVNDLVDFSRRVAALPSPTNPARAGDTVSRRTCKARSSSD